MSSIDKPEFITTNSYTIVRSFLSDIFDRSGPHQILIINPHHFCDDWPLHDDLSIKNEICLMDESKENREYFYENGQNGRYAYLKYSHGDKDNQIFYTNWGSLYGDFIKMALDNPWTHVILVPSDQFTQSQINFLQRKFQ